MLAVIGTLLQYKYAMYLIYKNIRIEINISLRECLPGMRMEIWYVVWCFVVGLAHVQREISQGVECFLFPPHNYGDWKSLGIRELLYN